MRSYLQLTKSGIVLFALLTATAGYLLSLDRFSDFALDSFLIFLLGLYLICSGSFILNQAQEWKRDQKMKRTRARPIPQKKLTPSQAYVLSFWFLLLGGGMLFLLKPFTAGVALLTVLLYNVFYTLWWKQAWSYGTLLGAIPGALPPLIGYSLNTHSFLNKECFYLFFAMFLWQIPHFLSLALHYQEDYKRAQIPVLPLVSGSHRTLYEMGLYMIAYLGLLLISPFFVRAGVMYVLLLLPLVAKVCYEFYKYFQNRSPWIAFFVWINVSILVCFTVPVFDKWLFDYFMSH